MSMCVQYDFAVEQYNDPLHLATDTHVLGRCISCYKSKRGAEYCQLIQHHKAVRATACCECEENGNSVTKCRQEMHHEGENAFHMNKVTLPGPELPHCCLELQGLHMQHYSSRPGEFKEPYVTGYMVPYSDNNWADWFKRFTLQTGCEYTIHSGKQSNTQSRETGVIQMEGKLFTYTSAWSHAYSCLRGGMGHFKPLCLGKKNRSSLGTRRFGCKASVQVRLLNVSNGIQVLEIQVPMISAHLPAHNPSSVTDQLTMKPLPEIEEKVVELVQESFLNQRALRLSLKTWVEKELVPKHLNTGVIASKPSDYNRAYYPTAEDVRVMVKKAITRERNSLFDQEAVLQLLQDEQARNGLKYFFRQYGKCDKR